MAPREDYYNDQFTDEGAKRKAERKGCIIEYANDRVLQLDIDSGAATAVFDDQLEMLYDLGIVSFDYAGVTTRRSCGGNWHITIPLLEDVSIERRILLQALLGSDLRRELLSFAGLLKGQENPVLLFRPKVAAAPLLSLDDVLDDIPF